MEIWKHRYCTSIRTDELCELRSWTLKFLMVPMASSFRHIPVILTGMNRSLATLCLAVAIFIMVSTPAISFDLHRAQTTPYQQKKPEAMIEDGMKMILNAIQLLLKSIPQYKAPEVLENGDIIIRRVPQGRRKPKTGGKIEKET